MANQFELYLELISMLRDSSHTEDDYPHIFSFAEQLHSHLYGVSEKNLLTINNHKCDTKSYLCSNGGDSDCNGEDFSYPSRGSATTLE